MAEDEAAEYRLIEAIERVARLSRPYTREKVLWDAFVKIARLLGPNIVKVELPLTPTVIDESKL